MLKRLLPLALFCDLPVLAETPNEAASAIHDLIEERKTTRCCSPRDIPSGIRPKKRVFPGKRPLPSLPGI